MPDQPPNFLLFIADQHRHDWLGCAGGLPVRTPHLDRLSREGMRFTQAMTPSPLCAPARACLANGMDYHHCGVRGLKDNTPLNRPTYYQKLRESGYQVTGVGKFDLHKSDLHWGAGGQRMLREYGFTGGMDSEGKGDAIWAYRRCGKPCGPYLHYLQEHGWLERHLSMYEHSTGNLLFEAVTPLPDEAYCDNWIARNGLDLLQDLPKDQPWHLVVNFAGPHDPYDVTESMRDRWKDVEFPPPLENDSDDSAVVRRRRRNYAAMIENIDSQVGRFLDLLEERGESDNTVILYTADHGEMLGDHNRWQKSIWYDGAVRIPMIVKGPDVRIQKSGALVSFHDLGATLLDYAGLDNLPGSDARSIRPVLQDKRKRHRRFLESALEDWCLVFDGRFKLIWQDGQEFLLFDQRNDPDEMENLAATYPCKVRQLSGLAGWITPEPNQ